MTEAEDQIFLHLSTLLREHYFAVIRESDRNTFQMTPNLRQEILNYSQLDSLLTAIAEDECLAKFFPSISEGGRSLDTQSIRDFQSIVVWSDGSSEGMTPVTLSAAILGEVFMSLWSQGDQPSLDEAMERLPHSIELARNLAEKRAVKVPALVSIHNLELIGTQSLQIGNAVLRKPIRYDKSQLTAMAIYPDAKALALRLEIEFSAVHIRATSRAANKGEENRTTRQIIKAVGYRSMECQQRGLQDEANRACFAIVLSSIPGKILAPAQGWNTAANPLSTHSHPQISNARSISNAPFPCQRISKAAERKIARYAALVQRHPDVIDTGIRRILLAITERMYPEDAFVDAIVSWENLFSGTPETSLRVCGSMAKLLSSSVSGRRKIFGELSKLYQERSKLVHGSSGATPEQIYKWRESAIAYSLDAFRAVYKRDDLLAIKDSSERGKVALLGK